MATKALKKDQNFQKKIKASKKNQSFQKKDQNLPRSRWKVPKLEFHKIGMASPEAAASGACSFMN